MKENSILVAVVEGQNVMFNQKVFSTGTRGYIGTAKIVIDGKVHQANFQLYEVGSKPADKKK